MFLILTLDFGSNSNKYLISLYSNGTVKLVKKDFFIHKLAKELNIENYRYKMENFMEKIQKNLDYYQKLYKTSQVLGKAVGTEFYRIQKNSEISNEISNEILKINTTMLQKINITFEIISQKEESKLSIKPLKLFFNNYISIDLGGASTEITVKKDNLYKNFFYKFGCLKEIKDYSFIQDFVDFYFKKELSDLELILIGGSFVSTLQSLRSSKSLKSSKSSLSRKFFYTVKTKDLKNFLKKIENLKEEQISQKYPALKGREHSVKTALNFIIYLLEKIKKEKTKISLLTLLEGLTLELLELNKLEFNKIEKIFKKQ
ncbi:MAG: hypothetical protein ACK4GR_04540 [bacterium]